MRETNTPATAAGTSKSWTLLKRASGVLREQLDRHLMALLTAPAGGGAYDTLGSGILLRRDGRPGVLTAAHVARPISELLLHPDGRIPVMLASAKRVHEKALDGAVVPIQLKQKHQRLRIVGGSEAKLRRPDIAWIPLPLQTAERLEAETVHGFYEWTSTSRIEPGTYHHFVSGCVGVQSQNLLAELGELAVVSEFRSVRCHDFPQLETHDGWDFITTTVDHADGRATEERSRPPGVPDAAWEVFEEHPKSFSGMSGGPLWSVREPDDENLPPRDWATELWGMAFIQDRSPSDRRLDVHCHGPMSIERITAPTTSFVER